MRGDDVGVALEEESETAATMPGWSGQAISSRAVAGWVIGAGLEQIRHLQTPRDRPRG